MPPTPRPRGLRPLFAMAAASLMLLGLAACAPEPGDGGAHPADRPTTSGSLPVSDDGLPVGKDPQTGEKIEADPGEHSWSQTDDRDDPSLKSADLPAGFPSADFTLPANALIDNAGERGAGDWFVVLRAADEAQADDWWQRIIDDNGLTASDEDETGEGGRVATLTGAQVTASAMTLPQDDGSVLLSYDLSN